MIPNVPYAQVAHAAQHGSPAVLKAVGRLVGLSDTEREALAGGRVPGWFWGVLGLGIGVVAGVRAYRKWPRQFPKMIAGTR